MTIPARGAFGYDFVLLGVLNEREPYWGDQGKHFVRYYESTVFSHVVDPLDVKAKQILGESVILAPTQEQLDRTSGHRPTWPSAMVQDKDTLMFFVSMDGEVFVSPDVKKAVQNSKVLQSNSVSFPKLREIAQSELRRRHLEQQNIAKTEADDHESDNDHEPDNDRGYGY